MKLLNDKVILVTGGSSGIGQSAARIFAGEGATVAVCDIDTVGGQQTVDMIESAGGSARFVEANVASSADVKSMVATVVSEFGRLDGAFNNAGITGAEAFTADYEEDDWDNVLAVNLKGIWLCMKYEILAMLESGGGSIVNTSSSLGQVGIINIPAYVASKHGVIGITRAAALEYAQQGIRINAVAPGAIETPLMAKRLVDVPEIAAPIKAAHPIGRLGRTEEVGEAAAWLLSDRASFVHGSVMAVDGGYLAI